MSFKEYRELNSVKWNSYAKQKSRGALSLCAASSKEYREPNSVKWDSYTK